MRRWLIPPIEDADMIRKFGYNLDVDASSAGEDIIASGGNAWFPSAATDAADIDIFSSHTDDNGVTPGDGALTMDIFGLDSSYLLQSEPVTLNGTTDVHPTLDYIRIYRMKIKTVGGGATGTNVGNITVDDGAGNIFAYIPAGDGQTQQTAYTVPADYDHAELVGLHAALISKQAQSARLALQVRDFGGAWRTVEVVGIGASDAVRHDFNHFPQQIESKADIRLRAITATADNLEIAAHFDLWLMRTAE